MESTKAPVHRDRAAEMPSMRKGPSMTEMMWSLLPWVTFMTATPLVNLWAGLVAGGLVAVVVLGRAVARKKVHMLEVAGIASFVALVAALLAVRPGDIGTWATYSQAGAHGLLTVLVLGSVLMGRPFTESLPPVPRRPPPFGTTPALSPSTGRSPSCGLWPCWWAPPRWS